MYKGINKLLFIYTVSVFCAPNVTRAEQLVNLYRADVVAYGQNNTERNLAFKEGLRKIFTKILVGPNVLANKRVQSAIDKASQFVTKYDFIESKKNNAGKGSLLKLRVRFNAKLLLDFIRPSGLTVWDEARPETLIWLVVEKKGKKPIIFNEEVIPEIGFSFKKAAQEKALSIFFPLLDLEDERAITIDKIRKFDQIALYQASERYMAGSILTGVLTQKPDCWQATWFFYTDDQSSQTKTNCEDLQSVVSIGVNISFEKLALLNGQKLTSNQEHDITLKVSRVNGVADMTRLINYLRSVSVVRQAEWLKVEDVYVFYALKYIGRTEDLDDMLALGRIVNPLPTNKPDSGLLEYRLLPKK